MHIKSLKLLQFKNYREASLELSTRINCFTGNNGTGKTNLLDAIYYLSFCKSFSNPADSQNILLGEDFFVIQGQYQINAQSDEVYCGVKKGQKKVFKRNKKEYDRLADHIGLYPLVLIHPGDVELVTGGSEERRKFIDGVISQYNKEYLQRLLDYNRALQQRNILLKSFAEKRYFDEASLEIWDAQLIAHGEYIFEQRRAFFDEFKPVFQQNHQLLTQSADPIHIAYEAQLQETPFADLLMDAREKDRWAQHTTAGVHKDNLVFLLGEQPLKKFGSQGQQKSYVIALKLAQFQFTRQIKGFSPILLFDDIFDKLDPARVELLIALVSQEGFGQVFISDTHTQRLENILQKVSLHSRMFEVEKGEVKTVKDFNL